MARKIKTIAFAIKEVYQQAKGYFFIYILKSIITSTKIFLFSLFSKNLINEIVSCLSSGVISKRVFIIAFITIALEVVINLVLKVMDYFAEKSTMKYGEYIALKSADKSSRLRFEFYDNSQNRDELKQFNSDSSAIINLYSTIVTFVTIFISFCISLYISLKFSVLITLISLLITFPTFFIRKKIKDENYKLEQDLNLSNRRIDYFKSIFATKPFYQEIHVFNALKYFRNILINELNERNEKRLIFSFIKLRREFLLLLMYSILNFGVNLLIIYSVIVSKLTIGDYTYYNTIIGNNKNNVDKLVENFSEILILIKKVDNYNRFIYADNEYDISGDDNLFDIKKIEFRNVSFVYPNSKKIVLDNISFIINKNEKIAFAGINGAGKTTIINLLLKFYKPTSGKIYINDVDLNEINVANYWLKFSAMFQRSNLYNLSLRENLIISNIPRQQFFNSSILAYHLNNLGISITSQQIEMQVGKTFDKDGLIFSPGESQKINIAKTLLRNAPILILDEPSSSMDAISENKIMDAVFDSSIGKTLIFISHRLSNLKKVDKIIFVSNGRISEIGTHEDLMNNKSEYYRMYTMQAQKY